MINACFTNHCSYFSCHLRKEFLGMTLLGFSLFSFCCATSNVSFLIRRGISLGFQVAAVITVSMQ